MIEIVADRYTYAVVKENGKVAIVCKVCAMRSYNDNYIQHAYCSSCNELHVSLEYKAVTGKIDFRPTSEEPIEPGTLVPSTEKEKEDLVKRKSAAAAYKQKLREKRAKILEQRAIKKQAIEKDHKKGVQAIREKYPWLSNLMK